VLFWGYKYCLFFLLCFWKRLSLQIKKSKTKQAKSLKLKQNNLYSKSENIGLWLLSISIISIFLIFVLYSSINAYRAPDDMTIFYKQFGEFLNNPKDFKSIIAFFFDVTLFPHPKLTARVATVLSYFTLGNVNLRVFQVIGNLFMVLLVALFYYDSKSILNNKGAFALIGASLILIPISNSFWTISIISLPFMIMFLYLGLKYLIEERYLLSVLFCFLTIYSSGQGFLFFPVSTIYVFYLSIRNKKIDKKLLLYFLATFAICFSFFYFIYFPNKNPDRAVSIGLSSSIPKKIYTWISFLGSVFGSGLKEIGGVSIANFVGGLTLTVLYVWLTIRGLIKQNSKSIVFSLLGIFFILLGLLASVSRLSDIEASIWLMQIPGRYHIHSIFFTTICTILIYLNFKLSKLQTYLIVIFFLGLYGLRATNGFIEYNNANKHRTHINKVTIANDKDNGYMKKYGKRGIHKILTEAITLGTYKIPPSYSPEALPKVPLKGISKVDQSVFQLSTFASTDKVLFAEYFFYEDSEDSKHTFYLKGKNGTYFYKAQEIDLFEMEINGLKKNKLFLPDKSKLSQVSKYSLFFHNDEFGIPKGRYNVFAHIETPTKSYNIKLDKFVIK